MATIISLVLGVNWVFPGCLRAQKLPADSPTPVLLPPAAENKLQEALAALSKATRDAQDLALRQELTDLDQAVHLTPAQTAALVQAGNTAAEKSTAESTASMEEIYRSYYDRSPTLFNNAVSGYLARKKADPDEETGEDGAGADQPPKQGDTRVLDQAAWQDALDRTLTPEQRAAWEKAIQDRDDAVDPEIKKFVDSQLDTLRRTTREMIAPQLARLKENLVLSPDRAAALDALADAAVEQSLRMEKRTLTETFRRLPPNEREMRLKQRVVRYVIKDNEAPDRQGVWTEGLAKLLTDEDRATLQRVAEERRQRRVRAVGKILLSLLDAKIGFTAGQRERLLPLAERAAASSRALTGEHPVHSFSDDLALPKFYHAARVWPEDTLRTVLDPTQLARWRALCANPGAQNSVFGVTNNSDEEEDGNPAAGAPTPTPDAPPEPGDVERAVSDYLAAKTAAWRRETQARTVLLAEDFIRVAALPPPVADTLRLAAKGLAEEAAATYKTNAENTVRNEINGARPDNIRRKLAGLQSYNFTYYQNAPLDQQALWTKTVDRETTPAQRDAWQKEKDLREDARLDAVAGLVTEEVDRRVNLSTAQWGQLRGELAAVLKEYHKEIGNVFSQQDRMPWFLQPYSMFIPMAGIPEAELQKLLTADQWDTWTHTEGFGNAVSFWQSISANHEQNRKTLSQ